jgi:hypothetical protein
VLIVIAAVCLLAHIRINGIQYDNPIAQIFRNGELVSEHKLSAPDHPTIISHDDFEYEIKDGKIGMTRASCPDKLCVGMGFINGAIPIICLPNRVEIRVINSDSDLDGVSY